jgi:selenocysteine lyase/cysteine desulfurase
MLENLEYTIDTNEFPILSRGLYANHAAIAPWPRSASRAVSKFAEENARSGAANYADWLSRETQLRTMLAKLINASSANDIALLKNTTEGICTVANGIAWRRGDNVVIPADEFPSNRLPWLALQAKGVEVREVDIRSTDDPENALLSRMDGHTRLLSVSAIQWTDGLRLDLQALGSACRQNGVLFFVDAIQQLGAMQIDVEACQIDFLAADGHKWLLSPEGIAVFYCRRDKRELVQPTQVGWHMVDDPYRFDRSEWQPSENASRFEAGTPNTLGQVAMHAAVGLLLNTGMSRVESLIVANSRTLHRGIDEMAGVEPLRPFNPARASGIVTFRPMNHPVEHVYAALQGLSVSCALRGGGIRLSPHFYQAGAPIQGILDAIGQASNL